MALWSKRWLTTAHRQECPYHITRKPLIAGCGTAIRGCAPKDLQLLQHPARQRPFLNKTCYKLE